MIDCSGNWEATVRLLEPEPAGPLTLSAVRCVSIPDDGYPVSLSPDGSKLLSFHDLEGLWVGGIDRADAGSHVHIVKDEYYTLAPSPRRACE